MRTSHSTPTLGPRERPGGSTMATRSLSARDRFTVDSEAVFWHRLWPAEQSLGAREAVRLFWTGSCWPFQEARPTGIWLTQLWAASADPPLLFELYGQHAVTPGLLQDGRRWAGGFQLASPSQPHTPRTAWRSGVWTPRARSHTIRLLGTQVRRVQTSPLISDLERRWSAGRVISRWQLWKRVRPWSLCSATAMECPCLKSAT